MYPFLVCTSPQVKHENIIELVDVFGHVSSVSIVMDFMDTDLEVGTSL